MASPAQANAGVPMIFVTLPGMLLALLPIIAIESKVLIQAFNIGKVQIIKYTALTNAISTIIGIPLAWLIHTVLLVGFEYSYFVLFPHLNLFSNNTVPLALSVTLGAAWLGPFENHLYWMVPAASLFLLIPYFFASWYIEYQMIRRLLKNVENGLCRSATLRANIISYSFLAIIAVIWLSSSIIEKKFS